jgi:hypothetical protein
MLTVLFVVLGLFAVFAVAVTASMNLGSANEKEPVEVSKNARLLSEEAKKPSRLHTPVNALLSEMRSSGV